MSSSLSTSLSQIILRSEPDTLAPETLSSQLHDLTQSMSLPALNDLTLSDVLGDIVSSWGSSLFSRALLSRSQSSHKPRPSTLVVAFNVLKIQFLSFKRRIRGLEAENISLEHANKMLRSDAEAREEELSSLRADFYTEKYQTKVFAQHVKADKNKITQLNDKIDQAEKFIMAMVDLKLHEPVLYRAAKAVKEGDAAEDALIDAVKEASTQKLSAWSRIVPAIVGPRTPEHYVSAINLTLKARKDLRKRDKVCEFWKKIAKRDPTNATMVTPSASVLSDAGELVEEVMPKPAVLDELLTALENGDSLLRAKQNVPGIVPTAKSVQVLSSVQSESFAGTANLNTSVLQAETGPARVSSNSSATPPVAREQAIQVTPNKTGTTCSTKLIVDHVNKYPISPPRFKLTTPQATPVKSQTSSPIKSPPITPTKEMYIPTFGRYLLHQFVQGCRHL
ncbi:hypothetical protein B0H34DRAFT_349592 [Crassisporium funariophilum]|nr:hypothetical protein B0H34DRAFT_349592 [Crassisporium funariophilum]